MADSKIEWTDKVWNPVVGCTRVSAGCDNCYAVRQSFRNAEMGHAKYEGLTVLNGKGDRHFNGVVRTVEEALEIPLRWKKPRKVFVNSMSDLFHKDVPDEFIDRVCAVMALCPQHTFQVLTKRPERVPGYVGGGTKRIEAIGERVWARGGGMSWPLPNVLLGFSAENQECFNERWPHVKTVGEMGWRTWLSAEPLLGPIVLPPDAVWAGSGLKWIIAGGESGPSARPMQPEWARGLRDQCAAAGIPYLFKQWGAWGPREAAVERYGPDYDPENGVLLAKLGKKAAGRVLDGRTWDEFPEVPVLERAT